MNSIEIEYKCVPQISVSLYNPAWYPASLAITDELVQYFLSTLQCDYLLFTSSDCFYSAETLPEMVLPFGPVPGRSHVKIVAANAGSHNHGPISMPIVTLGKVLFHYCLLM